MVPTFCVDCDEVTPRDNGTRCLMCKLRAERDAARNLIREYAEACNDVIAHLGEPGANDRLTRHALAHEALMRFGESEAK